MAELFKHPCIKPGCSNVYEDEELDRYYCPSCNEERIRIAAKVDRKIGSQPREKTMSALEIYDSQAKVMQGPGGRVISFAPTKL